MKDNEIENMLNNLAGNLSAQNVNTHAIIKGGKTMQRRQRLAVGGTVLAVAAIFVGGGIASTQLGGPGGDQDGDTLTADHEPSEKPEMFALPSPGYVPGEKVQNSESVAGVLTKNAANCVYLEHPTMQNGAFEGDSQKTWLFWPEGYEGANLHNGSFSIVDVDGNVVAGKGDPIKVEGNEVPVEPTDSTDCVPAGSGVKGFAIHSEIKPANLGGSNPDTNPYDPQITIINNGFILTTYGSSTCPFTIEKVTLQDQDTLVITEPDVLPTKPCTDDLVENIERQPLPDGANPDKITTAILEHAGSEPVEIPVQQGSGRPDPVAPVDSDVEVVLFEDKITLTTYGSSSCPFEIDRVEGEDTGVIQIIEKTQNPDQACTMDYSPHNQTVELPEGLDTERLTHAHIVYSGGREAEMVELVFAQASH